MPQQVRTLVDIMKNDAVRGVTIETQCWLLVPNTHNISYLALQRIDFHNDWKVITMFIGGNDICDFCTDSVRTLIAHTLNWLFIFPKNESFFQIQCYIFIQQ